MPATSGLTMDYASLQTAATKVTNAKTSIEEVISAMDEAVAALSGNWSGQSYEAFVNAWQDSKPTVKNLAEAIGNFAPEINKTVSTQQEREATSAAAISNCAF